MKNTRVGKFPLCRWIIVVLVSACILGCGSGTHTISPSKPASCGQPASLISAIQGSHLTSTQIGSIVSVEGIVVGDFQETVTTNPTRPELSGFFVQEEDADIDGDPASSEGIFVYDPGRTADVSEGDQVRVTGTVSEAFGNTQLDKITTLEVCDSEHTVSPASIVLPVPAEFSDRNQYYEQFEGMLVRFSEPLTVTGQSSLQQYGQLQLSQGGRLQHYGQFGEHPLNQTGLDEAVERHTRRSIKLDDFNHQKNIDPVYHPQPGGFSVDNSLRTGATVNELRGVLEFRFEEWVIQPQKSSIVRFENLQRPPVPLLDGNAVVASLNVLNYFNGNGQGIGFNGPRGATSSAEFQRQTDKIVSAVVAMQADVLALMEIENDGDGKHDALATLVSAINRVAGAGGYDYIQAGRNGGTDDIKVAIIYKPAVLSPIGTAAVLASKEFTDSKRAGRQRNRPALAQTFQVTDKNNEDFGEAFTLVVLHLKSQASNCGEADDSSYHGKCNDTRSRAVAALMDWIQADPTDTLSTLGYRDKDVLVIGDINSYYQQTPMQVFYQGGYINQLPQSEYTYVYRGESGALDHALANPGMNQQVASAAIWHINSDENGLLDYNDSVAEPGEPEYQVKPASKTLYKADTARASDHDPVMIGLDLSTQ